MPREIRNRRSQWQRGLRCRSAADRLRGSWVRIPPGAWMFVSCTVFVLCGRGLCDGPIPRPEESYGLWCVLECDQVKISPSTPTMNKLVKEGRTTKRNEIRNHSTYNRRMPRPSSRRQQLSPQSSSQHCP
jgi:hypothetical protein